VVTTSGSRHRISSDPPSISRITTASFVLGSTSTESRYADTRNLYRWAWKDLVKISDGTKTAKAESKAN